MRTRYQLILISKKSGERVIDFGRDLEGAKRQANHYRKSFFRVMVKDASVYEVQTCWSEDRSNATANYKKVY